MKLIERIAHWSVRRLTRLAAVLALVGLFVIVLSILWPRPLPVIFAMSVGHGIGGAAFLCYLLAVLLDVARSRPPPDSLAPRRVASRPANLESSEPPASPLSDAQE